MYKYRFFKLALVNTIRLKAFLFLILNNTEVRNWYKKTCGLCDCKFTTHWRSRLGYWNVEYNLLMVGIHPVVDYETRRVVGEYMHIHKE